jgi:hypothetical protein
MAKKDFEKVLSSNISAGETGIHYYDGDEMIEITTSDTKLMTKIRKLAKVCPDVVIDREPTKETDGLMLALIPYTCLKLGVKRTLPEAMKKR